MKIGKTAGTSRKKKMLLKGDTPRWEKRKGEKRRRGIRLSPTAAFGGGRRAKSFGKKKKTNTKKKNKKRRQIWRNMQGEV